MTFFHDPESGFQFAQDARDGGLVIIDPASHGIKYARHLLRGRDIALTALRPYLQPISDQGLIAQALAEYRQYLEDAPRLRQTYELERTREQLDEEAKRQAAAMAAEAEYQRINDAEVIAAKRLRPALTKLRVSEREFAAAVRTISHLSIEDSVMKLADGKPVPLEVHDNLRDAGFSHISAIGYEIALQSGGDAVNKALGAARSWRMAYRPRRALQVLDPLRSQELDPTNKSMVLTVIAAALADLGELKIARACANEALRSSQFRPDYASRVLARIAMLEGSFLEGLARFDEADKMEARFWDAVERLEEAITRGANDSEIAALEAARQSVIPNRPESYDRFLESSAWKTIREAALSRANWRCEICESSLSLEVHHRTYDRFGGAEKPFDLEVLCRTCHEETHNWQTLYVARIRGWLADDS